MRFVDIIKIDVYLNFKPIENIIKIDCNQIIITDFKKKLIRKINKYIEKKILKIELFAILLFFILNFFNFHILDFLLYHY